MRVIDLLRTIDPTWKFAIGVFLVVRIALTLWALVLTVLLPVLVQNLHLFGAPILAAFDLRTSERYAYSRAVDQRVLTFRPGQTGQVVDDQTDSAWSLRDGLAVSGAYTGRALGASAYSVEEVFPYRGIAAETNLLLALWQRFDTNVYLEIAQRGYAGDDGSTVYFPLYPLLIRLSGGSLAAALVVANLALIGALYELYYLAEAVGDQASARRSVAYLLIFPTGFFLFSAYTESLFLFFALGALIFAAQGRWYLAALFGVFAALTRLQGALLIIPLAYMLWREFEAKCKGAWHTVYYVKRSIALLLTPLATVLFLVLTNLSLVTSYEGPLHARFVLPWDNLAASFALLMGGQGSLIDALNLLTTVAFGVVLVGVWRTLPRQYALYGVLMFSAPLFRMTTIQPLVSMMRYALAIFPVFILWGTWGKNEWVNRAVVYIGLPLELYLSAQFVMWGWVG